MSTLPRFTVALLLLCRPLEAPAQSRLPDTGQTRDYTATFGEDADYTINPPQFRANGDGTVTDLVTGLMWQRTDGGEMTAARAGGYADTLTLAGCTDWRLPTGHELFALLNHSAVNPAMDTSLFPATAAEYWYTSETRADDATRVWVANAGGGLGAHPMTETISAGGTRRFHVRCVRGQAAPPATGSYTAHSDTTVTDNLTGLTWRTALPPDSLTWEDALRYAETHVAGGHDDWRLPNVKELQSISSPARVRPCFAPPVFASLPTVRLWSSTTCANAASRAWDLQTDVGIVSYSDKTRRGFVLCVRGGAAPAAADAPAMLPIPGGAFRMGDHFGFVDPAHPSDETPVHAVRVDSFLLARTETTNQQYLAFLQSAMQDGRITVRDGIVYGTASDTMYCYTRASAEYSSIGCDGTAFSIADFRAAHPVVGVMWCGAAAYCNWLSAQQGFAPCYDERTWDCDFLRDGYRLPTEAEWEYAGRGGNLNPYFIYPNGDTINTAAANLPASGDPYETGPAPNTTPAGFYDGTLKQKSAYNWPGAAATYQTANGANGYGLFDMQGNVWEFVNDWYGQDYYSVSPYDNPAGPTAGFIMPDGKPYRGMRGGNWYNGLTVNGVNDGHSRVANRNPSYYRGPQDPAHPWYHVGFRVARAHAGPVTGAALPARPPDRIIPLENYPNPFAAATVIRFALPLRGAVSVTIVDGLGRRVFARDLAAMDPGVHEIPFDAGGLAAGVYFCRIHAGTHSAVLALHHTH